MRRSELSLARARGAALAACALSLLVTAEAKAAVLAPVTIDGPAAEVGELGGVAMAGDGTGGVVYRRVLDGRPHIFAARYDGRGWGAPQQVDVGQPYASAWPRIAAGAGGRLVVVWTQDGGPGLDGLWSATVPRGGTRFLAPTLVDFTVGEDSATQPALAMNDAGAALLVYRSITAFTAPTLPPGFVLGEVRLARFNGSRWQRLGVPANRNRAAPLPTPSADNPPQVAIDDVGNGVVAWQEPDDDLIPRIWARRIFGTRTGVALAASPPRVGDALVRGAADRPALAETGVGRAVVAFRQLPDPRDRAAAAQMYVNQLGQANGPRAARFDAPQLVGPAGDAPASLALGDETDALLGTAAGGVVSIAYAPAVPGAFALREQGPADPAPPPAVVGGPDARAVLASASAAGGGEVAVRVLDGGGLEELAPLSAEPGGPIRALAAAGSGEGDALVAWAQGSDGDGRIAVALVDAPPSPFRLTLPEGWSRHRSPEVSWSPATDVLGRVVYTVSIDGRRVARTRATALRLREGTLDQGSHEVRVTATDAAGQATVARPGEYRLDRQPPLVTVAVSGRRATVRVRDPGGDQASGPGRTSSVDWGDGATTAAFATRAQHRFAKAGTRTVSVVATDAAGNRTVVNRRIRVR